MPFDCWFRLSKVDFAFLIAVETIIQILIVALRFSSRDFDKMKRFILGEFLATFFDIEFRFRFSKPL